MTKLLVNITKIERNIKYINNAIKDFKYKIGVAKGNGYGHDSRIIIPLLVKNGCNVIALARMDECIECYEILKQLKKEKQIIIFCLGIVDDEEVKSALKYGITIPVSNIDQAKRYAKMNIKNLKVH
jgi:alanine racemase